MKRLLIVCSAVAFGWGLGVLPLHAQQTYYVGFGGGVSVPVGSTSDFLDVGPHGTFSFSWIPAGSRGLGVQLDAMYQHISGDTDALGGLDINQQLLNANLSLLYRFPVGDVVRIHPYVIGGGGIYNFDATGTDAGDVNSETKFGLAIGAGIDGQVSPQFTVFAETRYHNVWTEGDNFQLVPVTVGGRIKIGTK